HEFQLYFQLTLTLFLGMGLLLFIRWKTWLYPTVYYTLWIWFLLSLLLSLKELPTHSQVFVWPYRLEGTYTALVESIQTQTTVTDGICAPNDDLAFFITAAHTGRKCLRVFPTHTNTHVDLARQQQARDIIQRSPSVDEIRQTSLGFHIHYILATRRTVPAERIEFFKRHFVTIHDDGITYLFRIDNDN
ncbi:MAG: hypothetical protein RBU29_14325, partial [bacterium]|nr:hypothetical protein [bacterium]